MQRMHVHGISLPSLLSRLIEYNFVAMATSLDKSENKVQFHHLHLKRFHTVKRLQKSVQYIQRYSTKYASFLVVSYQTFTHERCQLAVTGPKFTKFLHDIEASFMLLMRTLRWRYPIPFQNARATKKGSLPFFHKIGCHGNVEVSIDHLHPKRFHSVKRLRKSVEQIL